MRFSVLVILLLLIPLAPVAGISHQTAHADSTKSPFIASVPRHINGSLSGLSPSQAVNVFRYETSEPAPMGIADYGIGSSGAYRYAANQSLGKAEIVSLSTKNATGDTTMTIQLNVNLQLSTNNGVRVYWVQDVAAIDTSDDFIEFIDNIWNSSSSTQDSMSGSALSGGGTVASAGKGSSFYYDVAKASLPGNNINLSLPTLVQLQVVATVVSNRPVVAFEYNDGNGWQTYDTVTFLTSGKMTMPGFVVDGTKYNPFGNFYNSELILGGPGNGLSTSVVSSDVRLQLFYFNNHNFQMISNAYNFGSDTAEGISNTLSEWYYYLQDGENIAYIHAGAGTLGALYDSTEIGQVVYLSSFSSGIFELENATNPAATLIQYPFVGGQATVTTYPGTYKLFLNENGVITSLGTFTLGAGNVVTVTSLPSTTLLTLSYSTVGGGSGFSPPLLTFTHNGLQQTIPLTTTATPYALDTGTSWSISSSLPGSSLSERWATDQPFTGTAGLAQAIQFVYYHQSLTSVSYSVSGGGSPSPPAFTYTTFGSPAPTFLTTSAADLWADSGSPYSVPQQLSGSSADERWSAATTSGTVKVSSALTFAYYHQYYILTGYSVSGGGSGSGVPSIQCPQFGSPVSAPTGSSTWADAGSSCVYSALLSGSTQNFRWAVSSPNAPVNGAGIVSLTYFFQYPLAITYSVVGGPSPSPPTITGVFFGSSSTVPLSSGSMTEWLDAGSPYVLSNPLPSSTSTERWSAPASTSGVLNKPASASVTFYHQFLDSGVFAVVGGGAPTPPHFSYVNYGSATSVQLSGSPQSFWADGGSRYSSPPQLNASASERWSLQSGSGTIQISTTLTFTYYHQFLLTVTGAGLSPRWYNASSSATISVPGVFGRALGSGQRISSYSIDSASPTSVQPTGGTVTISLQMNAAHTVSVTFVNQFKVTLGAEATVALSSITPPTIQGDDYWYDQGAPVRIVLNGIWNRLSGTGERLTSYAVNGNAKAVSTSGQTTALDLTSISSPQTVTATFVTQYQLTTSSGSISSLPSPQIAGDNGWYDSGTTIIVVYNYSWNPLASQSRTSAIAYTLDQGAAASLKRTGVGTFQVQVAMTASHKISIQSVTQYQLTTSGGNGAVLSAASPTGDAFYDSGSSLTATTDFTWGLVSGNTRQNLVSYGLDGQVTNVTRAEAGTFTTPAIVFGSSHHLSFGSVTQFLISLEFQDSSGATSIQPSSVQLQVNDPTMVNLNGSQIWFDSGTKFQVRAVVWEGSDVTPTSPAVITASGPNLETIPLRVYDARLAATDYLGFPVSGATVTATLVNGTTLQAKTGSDGEAHLGLIPIGTFQGKVSYLGATTSFAGDATTQSSTRVKVLASYPFLALVGIWIAVAIVAAALLLRRRGKVSDHVVDIGFDQLDEQNHSSEV